MALYIDRLKGLSVPARMIAVNVAVCYVLAYALAQPAAGWVLGRTAIPAIWQERLTKLGGMALYTLLNYFGQRFFAFRRSAKG